MLCRVKKVLIQWFELSRTKYELAQDHVIRMLNWMNQLQSYRAVVQVALRCSR